MTKRVARVCAVLATALLVGCTPGGSQQATPPTVPVVTPSASESPTPANVWTVPAGKFGVAVAAPIPAGWLITTSPYDMVMSNTPFGQPPLSATLVLIGTAVPTGSTVGDRMQTYVAATEAVPGISNVSDPRESEVDGHNSISIDYSIEQQGVTLSGTMTWVIVDDVELNLTQTWSPQDVAGAGALVNIQSNMRIG